METKKNPWAWQPWTDFQYCAYAFFFSFFLFSILSHLLYKLSYIFSLFLFLYYKKKLFYFLNTILIPFVTSKHKNGKFFYCMEWTKIINWQIYKCQAFKHEMGQKLFESMNKKNSLDKSVEVDSSKHSYFIENQFSSIEMAAIYWDVLPVRLI